MQSPQAEQPLANVRTVGDMFLISNCAGLTSINLAPLHAIEEIPSYFIYGCSGLLEIDLSPLVNVRTVSDMFLSNCPNLMSIHLAPLHAEELPSRVT